jgi:hypothetical protein
LVQSLIDQIVPVGQVPLSHFTDNFDGSVLNERWKFTDTTGTGSHGMGDSVDGGYELRTGASIGSNQKLDFNNIRHYDPSTGLTFIAEGKMSTNASNALGNWGLNNDAFTDAAYWASHTATDANFHFYTAKASSFTFNASSIANDTNWHRFRSIIDAASAKCWLDDVLEVVNTADLPTVKLQPFMRVIVDNPAIVVTQSTRYYEAYNN